MLQLRIIWRFLGGSTQWNVSFAREAHDWEMCVFASFFQVLHSVKVSGDRADRLVGLFQERFVQCQVLLQILNLL